MAGRNYFLGHRAFSFRLGYPIPEWGKERKSSGIIAIHSERGKSVDNENRGDRKTIAGDYISEVDQRLQTRNQPTFFRDPKYFREIDDMKCTG